MTETDNRHPLTQLRESRGQTLEAFAAEIGASKGMVWKWENGVAIPRPTYMNRILKISKGIVTPNDWYEIPATVPDAATTVSEKKSKNVSGETA